MPEPTDPLRATFDLLRVGTHFAVPERKLAEVRSRARRRTATRVGLAAVSAVAVVAAPVAGYPALSRPDEPDRDPPVTVTSAGPSPADGQTSTTAPPGTSPAVGGVRCRTADLHATIDLYTPPGRAGGSQSAALALTNRGDRPCRMSGYPDVWFLDAGGQPRETSTVHAAAGPVAVLLDPGGTAWSIIEWMFTPDPDEQDTEPLCGPKPAQARITPPGESGSLLVHADFGRVCRHGEILVGAVSAFDPRHDGRR